MNTTAWVAIAGIAGTLLGALLAPVLAESMRRKSKRAEQLRAERLTVYADLLRVTARMCDNAMHWSENLDTDPQETDSDDLDRVFSQARVVASKKVYECFNTVRVFGIYFNQQRHRLYLQRLNETGPDDDELSIAQREEWDARANRMWASYLKLQAAVREEMSAE